MLAGTIAEQLRTHGRDVEAVTDHAHLRNLDDGELLDVLESTAQALVTDNAADFVPLHADFLARESHHAGIVLCKLPRSKATIGLWVAALDGLFETIGAQASLEDRCVWI